MNALCAGLYVVGCVSGLGCSMSQYHRDICLAGIVCSRLPGFVKRAILESPLRIYPWWFHVWRSRPGIAV